MSYTRISNHKSMLFDTLRNSYYQDAINKFVTPDSVVMDLGAGLGLHAFMALAAGAKKVYIVEPSPVLEIAKQIAFANNCVSNVVWLHGKIEEVVVPEKVDVIISVFTGNFLLTENLLPSLFYARDKYLKTGGTLIPDRAIMQVSPVNADEFYADNINCWSNSLCNINYELAREYAVNRTYKTIPDNLKGKLLGESTNLLEMDFTESNEAACKKIKVQTLIECDGVCHGFLGWFEARVGDSWISTSPEKDQMHWSQVFLPLRTPIHVKKNDTVEFELNWPEYGDCTWVVSTDLNKQRMSTFLSQPLSTLALKKRSGEFKGQLSDKGRVTAAVLQLLNGEHTNNEIIDIVLRQHLSTFANEFHARNFVVNIVAQFSNSR